MRRPALQSVCLAALALLSGCNRQDAEERSTKERPAAADPVPDGPQPGRYRTTVRVLDVAIPGLTGAQARAAGSMFGPQGHVSESCLRAGEAAQGVRRFAAQAERGKCRYERFSAAAGKVEGAMVCAVAQGVTTLSQVSGSYSASGSTLRISAQTGEGGSAMRMDSEIVSERIGDC